MVKSFDTEKNGPRIFVLSLPHGPTVDKVLDELLPLLTPGDLIIDGKYMLPLYRVKGIADRLSSTCRWKRVVGGDRAASRQMCQPKHSLPRYRCFGRIPVLETRSFDLAFRNPRGVQASGEEAPEVGCKGWSGETLCMLRWTWRVWSLRQGAPDFRALGVDLDVLPY